MKDKSVIVPANSSEESWNADCDFALIDFTPELLRKLVRLKGAFLEQRKRFKEVNSWHLAEYSATFISRKAAEALLGEEKFEEMDSESGGDPFPVPGRDTVDLEKFDATNADEMVLAADGVWWRAFPKHAEISVESAFIPWDWFSQCAHCGLRPREHAKGKCLFSPTGFKALAPGFDSALQARRRRTPKRGLPKLREP